MNPECLNPECLKNPERPKMNPECLNPKRHLALEKIQNLREGFVFCWVYINIVYIMPTIGEIFVILLGFFGPFGPWVWGDVN